MLHIRGREVTRSRCAEVSKQAIVLLTKTKATEAQ